MEAEESVNVMAGIMDLLLGDSEGGLLPGVHNEAQEL